MNRDDIIRIAEEAGVHEGGAANWVDGNRYEDFAKACYMAGAAAEREECAKVCDRNAEEFKEMRVWADDFANELGRAIRARGQV